jgi:hypothetical protein
VAICVDCAGIPRSFICTTCGTEGEQWFSSTCLACSLQRRLRELLDDGTSKVAPALEPLAELVSTSGRPWARLIWLSRGSTAAHLEALARGRVAIDHSGLDSLRAGKEVEYLRQLLMAAGIIERRDTQLGNFERWSARWLAAIDDPEHQRLLRTYLRWRQHRDLSARGENGPVPYSSVSVCRDRANAGLSWLRWLAEHGSSVRTLNQSVLDTWFATAANPRAAEDFIRWAQRHSHCPKLKFPKYSSASPAGGSEPERRRLLDTLLGDENINVRERVAGCLVLGLAQPVNRICDLTIADIEVRGAEIFLALGRDPVPLPAPLAALLAEMIGSTRAQPDSDWLFPGNFPGSHLSGRALSRQLSGLGVLRTGRQAALARLIGTMPSPLIAGSLGYHPNTVASRARSLGTDWAAYAAAKARENANV